jgi:hypothetical protein
MTLSILDSEKQHLDDSSGKLAWPLAAISERFAKLQDVLIAARRHACNHT